MASEQQPGQSKIPTNPHGPAFWGLLIILVGLGGFLTWAAFAPLSSGAYAQGELIVESKSKKVQHLEGGFVDAIEVDSGDHVEAGDVLIRLDTTQLNASLAMSQAKLDAAVARYARLLAERDGADTVEFPASLISRSDEERIDRTVENQRALFEARRAAFEGELSVLDKKIASMRARIAGQREEEEAAQAHVGFIDQMLETEESLEKEGYTSQQKVLELKRSRAQAQERRAAARTRIREAEARIQELESQILQTRSEFTKKVVEQLQQLDEEIATYRQRVIAARDKVDRSVIRAPTTGEIVGLQVHTVGGVVPPRETLMEIVPQQERLVIEARVRPQDIDRVSRGQMAEVRFTSLDSRSTPVVVGRVKTVSADRLRSRNPNSGSEESYYSATVTVTREELAKLGDKRLIAGMPVQVIIKAGSRTPLEYLIKPLSDSIARSFLE